MTKLLRKYNKWLIAIFGSFLMVTFLLSGPQSCTHTDPSSMVEGTLGGRKVRAKELSQVGREFEALKQLAPDMMQGELAIKDGAHWMLLVQEAQRLGLVGNAADGKGMLDVMAKRLLPQYVARQVLQENESQPGIANFLRQQPQFMQQMVNNRLQQMPKDQQDAIVELARGELDRASQIVAGESRMTRDEFDVALAKLRGVTRLVEGYAAAGRMSDRRMLQTARTIAEQALADVVMIPASSFVDAASVPDEARLQQQYEKFKAAEPGSGNEGFGYAQPARVKLEWMKLDRQMILGAITIDPVEAYKLWQTNRANYTGEFAAERAKIEADLKERRLEDVLAEADRVYKAKVRSDTRKLEVRGGIKILPGDYAASRTTMHVLAGAIVEGVRMGSKLEIPSPAVTVKDDAWVKVPEARMLPDIGGSRMQSGSKALSFQDALMTLHELNTQGQSTTGMQALIPFDSPFTDVQGNRYYITVLAARPPSPADSLEEVRAQVVTDVQEQVAFEKLSAELNAFQERAASEGLDALAGSLAGRVSAGKPAPTVQRNLRFGSEVSDPSLGANGVEPLRNAVMQQMRTLGVMTPATRENQALRTVGVALPLRRAVAIAQVNGAEPISLELVRTLSGNFAKSSSIRELSKQSAGDDVPFSFEGLSKRLNWQPIGEEKTREEKDKAREKSKAGQG